MECVSGKSMEQIAPVKLQRFAKMHTSVTYFFNVYLSLIISKKAFLILEGIMHAFASHTIPKGHILSKNPLIIYIFEACKTVENH